MKKFFNKPFKKISNKWHGRGKMKCCIVLSAAFLLAVVCAVVVSSYIYAETDGAIVIVIDYGSCGTIGVQTINFDYWGSDTLSRNYENGTNGNSYGVSIGYDYRTIDYAVYASNQGYKYNGTDILLNAGYETAALNSTSTDLSNLKVTYVIPFSDSDIRYIDEIEYEMGAFYNGVYASDWVINEISIYYVEDANSFGGCRFYGSISDKAYLPLKGFYLFHARPYQNYKGCCTFDGNGFYYYPMVIENDLEFGVKSNGRMNIIRADYTTEVNDYIIKIDLADVYDAGISAYLTEYKDLRKLTETALKEYLVLELKYKDWLGNTQTLKYPVTLCTLIEMYKGANTPDALCAGLMQQGSTAAFRISIPDCSEITGMSLIYSEDAGSQCNLIWYQDPKGSVYVNPAAESYNGTLPSDDVLKFVGISIYDGSSSNIRVDNGSGLLWNMSVTGTPLYYYASSSEDGTEIKPGETVNVWNQLTKYKSGDNYTPKTTKKSGTTYLVLMNTDDISMSGSPDNMTAKFQYVTYSGAVKETPEYDVKQANLELYGYIYRSGSSCVAQYNLGTKPGQTIGFLVTLSDCDYFTSFTLKGEKSGWEYQLGSLEVWYIKSIGDRVMSEYSGSYTDRIITRNYDLSGNYRILNYNDQSNKLFINSLSPSATINFKSGSAISTGDVDWNSIRDRMTYEEATQDFEFSKSRCQYTVDVEIDSNADAESDDSGSANKFYFQLIFKGGVSGYVLANQQLSSDRFRVGKTESFTINTNQDYGQLVSIRIIPDDISESNDIYDKMNVKRITVTLNSSEALSTKWVISDVGWRGIDYSEEGAKSTASGRMGRSEAEISHSYLVTSTGYSLNLLFAITTSSWSGYESYSGTLTGVIGYTDMENTRQTKEIDVASLMCEYSNQAKEYKSNDTVHALVPNYVTQNKATTGRFIVSLSDVKSIEYIILNSYGTRVNNTWKISDISVFQIKSLGMVNKNIYGEYQRTAETELICSLETKNYEWSMPAGKASSHKFVFNENKIEIDMGSSTWTSAITRTPESETDVLNIFVFMDAAKSDSITKYDMNGTVYYHKSSDETNEYAASFKKMNKDTANNMFYALGVSAGGASSIPQIYLKATGGNSAFARVSYVIIQQVRSGVVIDTYGYKVNSNVEIPGGCTTQYYGSMSFDGMDYRQTVTLQVSPNAGSVTLSEENNLAVAIKYTSTLGNGSSVYSSRYIYLTDCEYEELKKGQVVTVTFDEAYVKDITGLTIAAIGDVTSVIEMATVVNEKKTDTDTYEFEKMYSFTTAVTPSVNPRTISPSASAQIGYIGFEITTSDANPQLPENVQLVIHYIDNSGNAATRTITDLRSYIVSGGIASGDTLKAEMLISGVDEFRYVEIVPSDDDSRKTTAWSVATAKATARVGAEEKSVSYSFNTTIYEDEPKNINIADINMTVVALIYDETSETYNRRTFRSGLSDAAEGIIVKASKEIRFDISLAGSYDSIDVVCKRVVNGSTVEDAECIVSFETVTVDKDTGNSEYTVVFRSAQARAAEYQIVFTSSEMQNVSVTVNIVAESET